MISGEMSVFYLFTRYQFNWSEVQFSIFSTYNMLTGLIGNAQLPASVYTRANHLIGLTYHRHNVFGWRLLAHAENRRLPHRRDVQHVEDSVQFRVRFRANGLASLLGYASQYIAK